MIHYHSNCGKQAYCCLEINADELVVDTERKETAPQGGFMRTQISHLRGLSRSNTHLESPSSTLLTPEMKQALKKQFVICILPSSTKDKTASQEAVTLVITIINFFLNSRFHLQK